MPPQLLLEHASDMYAMTGEGKQAVHYAVKNNSIACAMLLFERDSRLAHTDSNNEPLIHLANSKEMVNIAWPFQIYHINDKILHISKCI